jgi:ubiquinone/menaquinone biosynthesis C-methylase UbiE
VKELKFNQDAEKIIKSYLEDSRAEISGFEVEPKYLQMLMFDFEHFLRFFSIKHANRRGSNIFEKADINDAVKKFGKPKKFVTSQFKDPKTLSEIQNASFKFLEWMGKKLDEFKSPVVLDAGCRWGRSVIKLHDYYGKDFKMVGVDIDEFSLKYGRGIDKLLNVVKSKIENLPFRNNSFDIVLCSGVIHEIKTWSGRKEAVREFYDALKPNGALCIIDVFSANPIVNIFTRILQHVTSRVEWIFPKAQLEKILKENNFAIIHVQKTQSRLFGAIETYTIIAIKRSR